MQSGILIGGMALLLGAMGWLIANWPGAIVALGAVVFFLATPRLSPQAILRMYRARPLSTYEAPELLRLIQLLAQAAGLPTVPRLYYVPSIILNAFTVGRADNAAIGVTDGLLRRLNMRQLAGVLAHEIGHLRNNDTRVMGLADVVSRLTSALSTIGQVLLLLSLPLVLFGGYQPPWLLLLLLIFAPTLSALLQLALSRTREFDADLEAIALTGDPLGLASALEQLERSQRSLLQRLFIPTRQQEEPSLLRTHPATAERIQRLLELAEKPLTARLPAAPEVFARSPFVVTLPRVARSPRQRFPGVWF